MDNNKNFSGIFKLLANGIGSTKANFKSTIDLGSFIANENYDFCLSFSNKTTSHYLGKLELRISDLELNSKSKFEHPSKLGGEVIFTIPTNVSGYTKKIQIRLLFWDEIFDLAHYGECYIVECIN